MCVLHCELHLLKKMVDTTTDLSSASWTVKPKPCPWLHRLISTELKISSEFVSCMNSNEKMNYVVFSNLGSLPAQVSVMMVDSMKSYAVHACIILLLCDDHRNLRRLELLALQAAPMNHFFLQSLSSLLKCHWLSFY